MMFNMARLTLCVLLLALGVTAQAQQPAKIAKIGWLSFRSASSQGPGRELFLGELRALGYIEGKNLAINYRHADGKIDRLPSAASELVQLRVDVILAAGTNEALAARNATRTIPIVFHNVSDPVAAGLIDSLARPGGNITGFTTIGAVLAGKRLELLKETLPKLSRAAVLWNPQDPSTAQQWKESQLVARQLGMQLHSMEASGADNFDAAFKEAINERSAALAVTQSALALSNQKRIVELAAKHRLPAIYPRADYVSGGGLVSYGADQFEPYKRAVVFVDKILKGTKPADIPVEQPTKFEFVINLKTAKQIGLTIPPNVLARADRVIR
jgi:putative tryptophan/tyrosine transport system substrate-binding protein